MYKEKSFFYEDDDFEIFDFKNVRNTSKKEPFIQTYSQNKSTSYISFTVEISKEIEGFDFFKLMMRKSTNDYYLMFNNELGLNVKTQSNSSRKRVQSSHLKEKMKDVFGAGINEEFSGHFRLSKNESKRDDLKVYRIIEVVDKGLLHGRKQ